MKTRYLTMEIYQAYLEVYRLKIEILLVYFIITVNSGIYYK